MGKPKQKQKKKRKEANMAATYSSPPSKHPENGMETAYLELEHTETTFTAMQCCCASNKETSYSFV